MPATLCLPNYLKPPNILAMLRFAAYRLLTHVHALAERLHTRGKRPKMIIGATMRTPLHLIYGALKSGAIRSYHSNGSLSPARRLETHNHR